MMHNGITDLLRLPGVAEIVKRAKDICTMIRKSPAKWEQFRQVQLDRIKGKDEARGVEEEEEEDVDD